ncbi:MAG TPA: hypothetical protein VGR81_04015 [Candidatus Acidoferrales bacterium]|nr:hypothetical protein [Candidatus Acidoferrales bacterium]
MQITYRKLLRVTVFWVVLLGAMAAIAGRSAVVLASSGSTPLIVCSGFCNDQTDCTNPGCYCESQQDGGTCRPLH